MNRTPFVDTLVVIVIAITLSAGCIGQDAKGAKVASTSPVIPIATHTEETGGIEGHVLDKELQPIQGASVEVIGSNLSANTTNAGAFAFNDLAPGQYYLVAKHVSHVTSNATATVVAGASVKVVLELESIPAPIPFIDDAYTFAGMLTAAACADPGGVPTSCYTLAQQKGVPAEYSTARSGAVPLDPGWKTIQLELAWTPGTGYSGFMNVTLAAPAMPAGDSTCASTKIVAVAGGASPVRLRLDASDFDTLRASDPRLCAFGKSASFIVNPFAKGSFTLFAEQKFTVYGTVAYVTPLADAYSRIPS